MYEDFYGAPQELGALGNRLVSPNGKSAPDHVTLVQKDIDMKGSIFFKPFCHSGRRSLQRSAFSHLELSMAIF